MRLDVKMAILKSGRPQWEIAQAIGVPEYALSRFIREHGTLPPEKIDQLKIVLGLGEEETHAALH